MKTNLNYDPLKTDFTMMPIRYEASQERKLNEPFAPFVCFSMLFVHKKV